MSYIDDKEEPEEYGINSNNKNIINNKGDRKTLNIKYYLYKC